MEAIASDLGVSRSSVSRLLSQAREIGLVQINVMPSRSRVADLERRITQRFGIDTRVVVVPDTAQHGEAFLRTAQTGAEVIGEFMAADAVLSLSWGTMLNAISRYLTAKPCTNSRIIQTNGVGQSPSGSHYSFGMLDRFASSFGSSVQQFPFPIFVDSAEAVRVLEQEQLLRRIRALISNADIFLFNVGTVEEGVPSQPYLNGYYLDESDFYELRRSGAVGDVSTTFIDAKGESRSIGMNARTTGPDLDSLREIRQRICVTSGANKVRALHAALKADLITDLVVDELTATLLLGV